MAEPVILDPYRIRDDLVPARDCAYTLGRAGRRWARVDACALYAGKSPATGDRPALSVPVPTQDEPDPQVRIREGGGTEVKVGAWTNGQFLRVNGTTLDSAVPSGGSPSGPAGGHLEGTYPDPSVRGMTVKQHIGVSPAGSWDIGTSGAGLRNVYAFRFVTPIVPIALF